MRVKVIKGGWLWNGEMINTGDVLLAPSAEWVANRVRDGVCEPIAEEPSIEIAVAPAAAETAVIPRPKKR